MPRGRRFQHGCWHLCQHQQRLSLFYYFYIGGNCVPPYLKKSGCGSLGFPNWVYFWVFFRTVLLLAKERENFGPENCQLYLSEKEWKFSFSLGSGLTAGERSRQTTNVDRLSQLLHCVSHKERSLFFYSDKCLLNPTSSFLSAKKKKRRENTCRPNKRKKTFHFVTLVLFSSIVGQTDNALQNVPPTPLSLILKYFWTVSKWDFSFSFLKKFSSPS